MPDVVEEALKLLEIDSADVRFLGMYGMGGVGKTTLAKIIFNRISSSFDSCSFLENIREERSCKDLESLRKKLLQDLNPKAASDNMNISDNWDDRMKRCVRMKSVLIVLDDVGQRSHILELVGDSFSFGSRSRIIITTKDDRAILMNLAEASSSGEGRLAKVSTCITKMEVKGMNSEQAMQLFSMHAFGRNYPLENYTSLSKDVISICGGLPLALEVIGSLLYGMSVEEWEEEVTNLKIIPAEDVQQKLMISYNALKDDAKEIFLDIACFFIGEDKSNPIYMWKACGYASTLSIRVLIAMSLIKITDDGKFWMHDQLRDLGREIVRIKGHNSRILTYKDASSVQDRNKEKEVVALCLQGRDDRLANFAKFKSLRFLQVTGSATFHHRNFWRLSKDLTWLSLVFHTSHLTSPIKSMFSTFFRNRDSSYLMKLAVLRLSGSAITDNWKGWIVIQELRRLKVLDLTGCTELTRTPNFSKMESLEKLILRECSSLAKIYGSIGKLQKLKYLNLVLCFNIEELPEEVGNLENVEEIIMIRTNVSKLPNSIGKLKNLEHLNLSCSNELEKLPECIGYLRSLIHLDINFSRKLKELPATIGLLAKLKHLNLSKCECLNKLPDSIGDLTSLVSLDLESCQIKELPRTITRLEQLERLTLWGCRELVKLPDELGKLKSLVELNLSFTGVAVLPESIGDLARLQVMDLHWSRVSVLPETVAKLSLLQKLDLSKCERIDKFPELPTSLTDLKLNACSLRQALHLSKLTQLRALTLVDDKLGVGSIQQEKSDAMEKLSRLEVLELDLRSHTSLPVEFSALTRLKSLTLRGDKLTRIPPFPSSLQSLELRDLGMEGLPNLSQLKSLQVLRLLYCEELVEIPGLGTLVSLIKLYIYWCGSLRRLENIKNLISLRHVEISWCCKFTGIQDIEDMRLSTMLIRDCNCNDKVFP